MTLGEQATPRITTQYLLPPFFTSSPTIMRMACRSYYVIPLPVNVEATPLDRVRRMNGTMKFIKQSPEAFFIREGNKTIWRCCGVNALMNFNAVLLVLLAMVTQSIVAQLAHHVLPTHMTSTTWTS